MAIIHYSSSIINYPLSIIHSACSAHHKFACLLSIIVTFTFLLTACERPSDITPTISISNGNSGSLIATPTLHSNIINSITAVPPQNKQTAIAQEIANPSQLIPCAQRINSDDLTIYIDKQYSVSPNYIPPDLVNLVLHVPSHLILGEHYLRQETAVSLGEMVAEMIDQDLQPTILSAYRDYNMQAASYAKWQREQPARADIISARPGSSEHQLGTTVDFGSPELAWLVGPNIQFHQQFANTSEGQWLAQNAHHYGFTLSYPQDSFDITGYEYEPWHFRYIGIQNATNLHQTNTLLLAWQTENLPQPCIP